MILEKVSWENCSIPKTTASSSFSVWAYTLFVSVRVPLANTIKYSLFIGIALGYHAVTLAAPYHYCTLRLVPGLHFFQLFLVLGLTIPMLSHCAFRILGIHKFLISIHRLQKAIWQPPEFVGSISHFLVSLSGSVCSPTETRSCLMMGPQVSSVSVCLWAA